MNQPSLKAHYNQEIVPELMKTRQLKNKLQVAKVEKIVLNSGVSTTKDKSVINDVAKDMALIAGQNRLSPVPARAYPISSCAPACPSG